MKTYSDKGFTFIEFLIVFALVGIIASFSIGISLGSLSKNTMTQERDLIITLLLRNTRTAALANSKNTAHGVFIDNENHQYVLFNGATYSDSNNENRLIPYSSNSIKVNSSGGDIILFEQISGNVIKGAGTMSISNGFATSSIIVRENGQIDW